MKSQVQEYSFYLVVGSSLVLLSIAIGSQYLFEFLTNDLVTLLVALLAINTTTSSVIMTKLKEISDKEGGASFSTTIAALRLSIYEQIIYVAAAVLLSIFLDSEAITTSFKYAHESMFALLSSIFVAALSVLFETAKSIFTILNYESHKS